MGITAAQLTANISVTGAQQAKSDIAGVSAQADLSHNAIAGAMGGIALAAGAAAVGFTAASVKMAGDFQTNMTQLVTGAGESKDKLKSVSDGILSLAVQTGTSTKQLSDGMYMIESAGYHGAAGLAVLKASAEGAKVGNADLGTVASAVTGLMHDYAGSNYTATQATNALITTVGAGSMHMQDLGGSLAAVLPLASSLHIPFEQVAGAIATMTNAHVPAQQATQNLAFAIRSMDVATGPGTKALKTLGLTSEELHNTLTTKGLPAALQLVEDSIGKKWPLGSMQGQQALKAIMGGVAGLNVALDLSGGHLKEYKGDVAEVGGALASKSTDVQHWSDVQGTFNFKMQQAQEAVEVLMIKFGTKLLPVLGQIMDTVTPLIGRFADWVTTGNNLSKWLDDSSPKAILLKGAVIALAGAFGGIMVASLVAVAVAAWAALVPLLPFIAIGAAIALVIAGIVLAVMHWGEIVTWLKGVWGDIGAFFNGLWGDIEKLFGGIGNWFHDRFTEAHNGIVNVFGNIGGWFSDRFTEAHNGIVSVFGPIGSWFADRWGEISKALTPVINFIGQLFQTLWNIQVAIWSMVGKWFSDRFQEAWKYIVAAFSPLQAWFQTAWQYIVTIFSVVGNWFHDRFTEAWNNIVNIFIQVKAWFTQRWQDIVTVFTPIGQWFHDRFMEAWNNIVAIFTPIKQWFLDRWNELISGVVQFETSIIARFNDVEAGVTGIFRNMINGIIDLLNDGITGVESFVNFFGQGLDNIAKALGTTGTIQVVHLGRIPHYAEGTEGHPGGPAIVGEQGRELVFLPKGASVAPNDLTEKLLAGGNIPGYASGTGDIGQQILGWVTGGAKSILDNVMQAMHINLTLPGDLSNLASGAMTTLENWAVGWINGLLSKFSPPGASGQAAGKSLPVNVSGSLMDWIMQAIGLTGVPANWANDLAVIAMHESGGNPDAINNWDSNAAAGHPSQGIMQTIPSTFAAHMVAGHTNILNPIDNIAAAIGYIKGRYGSVFNVPGIVSMSNGGAYQGYADGTNYAPGGMAIVGERGPEAMYIPRGAQIVPHERLGATQPVINITVQPAPINIDGRTLTNAQMPYIADAIRMSVGTHSF